MKLTPLDIQQQQFRRGVWGCDPREVQGFLDLAAQQLGEITRENSELRAELQRWQRETEEHRSREASLREAMLTAQRAIEDIREQARKEAQVIVSSAEIRAEKILHNVNSRVMRTQEDLALLRRQRVRVIEELRGVLNTHMKLIDFHLEEAASEELQGSVTVLDRLRAPSPPSSDELSLVDASG